MLFWPWKFYHAHHDAIAPLGATLVGLGVAVGALWQARTATRRHYEQTKADQLRRITENFSKAVEQLGHEKIEVRLGGIYALERISRESPEDYWTVMETLTAFIRERTRYASNYESEQKETPEPPTDIAAVLSVIARRSETNRRKERKKGWRFDLRGTDLRDGVSPGGVGAAAWMQG